MDKDEILLHLRIKRETHLIIYIQIWRLFASHKQHFTVAGL